MSAASKPPFAGEVRHVRLGDVCEVVMGQSPSSDSYNGDGEGFPFYQGNADFGLVHPNPSTWCTAPKKLADPGDLLLSVRAPIGAVNVANERCCIGRGVAALRHDRELVDSGFLRIQLEVRRSYLESLGTGSTFKAVGKKSLETFPLIVYPKECQIAIVERFEVVSEYLNAARRQLALLDDLVKSRFVEMFGDGSVFTPCLMSDLVSNIVSGSNVGGVQRPLLDGEYAVLKISAVTKGTFNPTEYKVVDIDQLPSRMIHPKRGDLLFSRANTSEMVGATAIVNADYDHLFLPDKLWRLDAASDVNSVFLKQLLSSPALRSAMSKASTGTSGSMQNISMAKFRKLRSFKPPISLQREFAAFAAEVAKSRVVVRQQVEKLQTLYDSLAQDYFG